ncbi:MAG: tryptophan synthase subunit alpha [Pirellulaceae bacterium]
MNRYEQCFADLQTKGQGAFVPFTVIGDPDAEASLEIIRTLANSGADALELGIPFSDPLADGPVIQGAMDRALKSGITPADCFEVVLRFRTENATIPIGLLVYANLVHAWGIDDFYRACRDHQIDSVLVADAPIAEVAPFCEAAKQVGVAPVLLCPPNIDQAALEQVASLGDGYTYLLSRAGVTGTNVAAGMPVEQLLQGLKDLNAPPPLLGFGISRPEHVRTAVASGAYGVIVGSAVIEVIQQNLPEIDRVTAALSGFVGKLKAATG